MKKYKLLSKGVFQKMSTFEDKLNTEYKNGWATKTITVNTSGEMVALLERIDIAKNY